MEEKAATGNFASVWAVCEAWPLTRASTQADYSSFLQRVFITCPPFPSRLAILLPHSKAEVTLSSLPEELSEGSQEEAADGAAGTCSLLQVIPLLPTAPSDSEGWQ